MIRNKVGQIAPLSAVLITMIVIVLVLVTYVWGSGLVNAQRTRTTSNYIETKLLEFEQAVNEVSQEGINSTRLVRFDLQEGYLSIENGTFCNGNTVYKNGIMYELNSKTRLVDSNSWVSIDPTEKNKDCTGSIKNNTAAVLLARSVQNGNTYSNEYMLWFRQLNGSSDKYLINLTTGGTTRISGGSHTAVFINSGTGNKSGIIVTNVTVDFV